MNFLLDIDLLVELETLVFLHFMFSNFILQRLHCELPNATIRQVADCGHLPHVEKPNSVARLISEFVSNCFHEGTRI